MTIATQTVRTLALSTLLGMLAACQSDTAGRQEHGPAHAPAHWGYAGEVGPSSWADLNPDYALCAAGQCQSPIDIVHPRGEDLPNPGFDYRPGGFGIVNNGHTVQVNCDPGSWVEIDGERYALVQFHFHAPSEHRVGGVAFAAEMHLVHKAEDGALAVVGVLIKPGRENAAFAPVWSQLPAEPGPARTGVGRINAADLLPAARTSFRYGGSLTTPPCSEQVTWTILATPIEMSEAQIKAFTRLYTGNNRPVQPLHGRTVVEDTTP